MNYFVTTHINPTPISSPTSSFTRSPTSLFTSSPIAIQQSPTNTRDDTTYILKQNSFDPTKNSPPNEFMSKLKSRMNTFYEK